MAYTRPSTSAFRRTSIPANATALPAASSRTDIVTRARQISFVDFAADDSGAMAHVIVEKKGAHIVRTLGGEQTSASTPRVFPWFGKRVAAIACTQAA